MDKRLWFDAVAGFGNWTQVMGFHDPFAFELPDNDMMNGGFSVMEDDRLQIAFPLPICSPRESNVSPSSACVTDTSYREETV